MFEGLIIFNTFMTIIFAIAILAHKNQLVKQHNINKEIDNLSLKVTGYSVLTGKYNYNKRGQALLDDYASNQSISKMKDSQEGLISEFIPLLEVLREKDIKLVIDTDYSDYTRTGISLARGEIKINLTSKAKSIRYDYIADMHLEDYTYTSIPLSEIKSRAKELKHLKAKLCKSKCKGDK